MRILAALFAVLLLSAGLSLRPSPARAPVEYTAALPLHHAPVNAHGLSPLLNHILRLGLQDLVKDERLLRALEKAGTALPVDLTPEQENRLVYLIQRSLPGGAEQEVTRLFLQYLEYRNQARRLSDAGDPRSPHRLEQHRALQRHVFGTETAAQIFGARNRMIEAMGALP